MKKSKKIFQELMVPKSGSVWYATKFQDFFLMQKSMLKFILEDSPSLARAVTKYSGLDVLSGVIEKNHVMVKLFQVKEDIEGA